MNLITTEHLTHSYTERKLFDDASFSLNEQEKVGIIGINGTGKSTLLKILAGKEEPDEGTVIMGRNLRIGYLPQNPVFPESFDALTAALPLASDISGDPMDYEADAKSMLTKLGITKLSQNITELSGGQRKRIALVRTLLTPSDILILDEPTTGLDPQTRKKLWSVVAQLRRDANMTVFLTTHYMEEAADADYVVILDSGRIAAEGTPLQLKNTYTGDFITLYGVTREQAEQLGRPYEELRGAYRAAVPDTAAATRLILEHADIFQDYEITKGGMDDVFLAVTGKSLEGGLPQHKGGETK